MNRFVLFGFVLIALSCFLQAAEANEVKRYVYNVRRDVRHVTEFDQDYDEDKNEEKRYVYRRSVDGDDADANSRIGAGGEFKRFVVSVKDAAEAAKNEDMDGQKDFKRFVYDAREARGF